jgi:hypothetical protein
MAVNEKEQLEKGLEEEEEEEKNLGRALHNNNKQITGVDSHVSVPRGPVVERLSADGTLLPLLRVPHAGRGHLLHVVIKLQLK